jgi:molecular chaperone DnaJ
MTHVNLYQILGVAPSATAQEIKQAYRQLAKQFHPDSQTQFSDHERITQVNAAYEVLGDPRQRSHYDQHRHGQTERRQERTKASQDYHRQQQTSRDTEHHLQDWIRHVYHPVEAQLSKIMNPLQAEIRALAADPYDDDLMADFQDYLDLCRVHLRKARSLFHSYANPSPVASVAANLYYCLNQLEDGLDEFERFTACYDDHYLSTGRELFRICIGLRREASTAIKPLQCEQR